MMATIATATNRCSSVLVEGVGGTVGAVRVGGPTFTAGPVQGGVASRCGSGGRKIPVFSAGGASGSDGVTTAPVRVGATEGLRAAERVRSGAEVRNIGIATAAVGVGALHASIGAVTVAVGGGALRLGSAKLELYPHPGVGAGGGAGTRTGLYFAFSAAESFFHIWPRVFSLSAL